MADRFNTIKENTRKLLKMGAADLKHNKLHFFRETSKVEKDAYSSKPNGFKPGESVDVHIPTTWDSQSDNFDLTGNFQDAKEQYKTLDLNMSESIGFDLDTDQLAKDIDVADVYKRLIRPAVNRLGARMEQRFIEYAAQRTGNLVGTAGAGIADPNIVMEAGEVLDRFLTPDDGDRKFLLDSKTMRKAVDANKNLFTFNRQERNKAHLGEAYNFEWFKSQLTYKHTNGNDVTGVAVESDVVTPAHGMTTLGVDGLTTTTGTLTKGTVFTIANVYAVDPITKVSTGELKQFTHVGATVTANGSGQATLTLNEAIYDNTDSRQNVDALPADEAAITIVGSASTTYQQSLLYHSEAFRVLTVPLYIPSQGVVMSERVSEDGVNLALIQYFEGDERALKTRLDVLGAITDVYPTHSCRLTA